MTKAKKLIGIGALLLVLGAAWNGAAWNGAAWNGSNAGAAAVAGK